MMRGFGIAFLEAAAYGVPSISGNSGGQAEAVIDGVYWHGGGWQTHRVKLPKAIQKLVSDKGLRSALGQQARERAEAF